MKQVNIHEAKTHLSRYVRDIATGAETEVVIAVGGKPAARIVPYEARRRPLGIARGLIEIPKDFDAPDEAIVALFEGSP